MNQVKRYIMYITSPIVLFTVFYMLMSRSGSIDILYIPIIGVGLLFFYMELFVMTDKRLKKEFWVNLILILMGTTWIGLKMDDYTYHIFYFLALFMVVRYIIRGKAICYTFIGVMLLVGGTILPKVQSGHDFFVYWLVLIGIYCLGIVILSAIEYIIQINQNLEKAQLSLVEKNLELSQAYKQLKRAYDELEDYTIIKECQFMSREMHDTVGHTLTTSLVELEICKMLVKNQDEVEERIEHIIEQVRKGLTELRITVRRLKDDLDWEQEIRMIGEKISSYTDIKVRTHMDSLEGVETNTLRCIYRIIQESLTNGMKHGKATAFMIDVTVDEEQIYVEIMDNGIGAIAFKHGFGLTAMSERVEALNGKIKWVSYKDEGFMVKAELPKIMKKEKRHD